MFEQNPMTGPGMSTLTNHTLEILIMLLGAAILGYFLGKAMMDKWRIRTQELEISLSNTLATLSQTQTELKACGEARASLERIREDLHLQIEDLENRLETVTKRNAELEPKTKTANVSAKMKAAEVPQMPAFDAAGALAIFGSEVVKDDLKIVEGIGPKLEAVFHAAGITTWEQMANTSAERLDEIMDAADSRNAMHDPTTWPEQCRLAAAGEWEALKAYQENLSAGRI